MAKMSSFLMKIVMSIANVLLDAIVPIIVVIICIYIIIKGMDIPNEVFE